MQQPPLGVIVRQAHPSIGEEVYVPHIFLIIRNAPAEAGAQPELHHRIFKQVFDIATKNTG